MRRHPVVAQPDPEPVPIPEIARPPQSPMWLILKGIAVGNSTLVNLSASYVRGMIGKLAERESDPAERRAMAARRYKVKQVDPDNTRVWRLK